MNYLRTWRHERNAVGFAAECARLTLPAYKGDHRQDLVRAIEIARACGHGEYIDQKVYTADAAGAADAARAARAAAYAARGARAAADAVNAANAAGAAANAADAARGAYATAVADAVCATKADRVAVYAADAGVDPRRILDAFIQWWARDVGVILDDAELRRAVTALLAIGEERQAAELAAQGA